MQPTLIAIKSDNRHVVYSVKGELGKGIFEGKIEELGGRKYYSHKGINYPLPYIFQCKRPLLRF